MPSTKHTPVDIRRLARQRSRPDSRASTQQKRARSPLRFMFQREVVNGPHLPCTLDPDWLDVSQRRRLPPNKGKRGKNRRSRQSRQAPVASSLGRIIITSSPGNMTPSFLCLRLHATPYSERSPLRKFKRPRSQERNQSDAKWFIAMKSNQSSVGCQLPPACTQEDLNDSLVIVKRPAPAWAGDCASLRSGRALESLRTSPGLLKLLSQ